MEQDDTYEMLVEAINVAFVIILSIIVFCTEPALVRPTMPFSDLLV